MITLEDFKANAIEKGICSLLTDWNNCKSKKQLMDLALDIRAIPYLANAVAEGWGISIDVIEKEFAPFLNGRYVRNKDGYTSSVWCGYKGDTIRMTDTATLVIGFNGIIIPPVIGELYLVNSKVKMLGEGSVVAYCYNSKITSSDKAEVRIKENKRY